MSFLLLALLCKSCKKHHDNTPPPRPAKTSQAQPQDAVQPMQPAYFPNDGPPGYVSPYANKKLGPITRKVYQRDLKQYGVVKADRRQKRRTAAGVAAGVAGG